MPRKETQGDAGEKELQARFDEAEEKGYFGTTADPTPRDNYTVSGVTSGADTPETREPGSPGSTKSDPDAFVSGTGQPMETDKPAETDK